MKLFDRFINFVSARPQKPTERKFGWKKDLHDPRDFKFKVSAPSTPRVLPTLVDLRDKMPPIYDQGTLGSCTANALGAAFQSEQIKLNKPNWIPSRLFIYYNERVIEKTVHEDGGAMIRTGIKTMVSEGVCPESMWKYVIGRFTKKPCPECYKEALNNQVTEYLRISPHTIQGVKECLADGYPVVFGFTLYESMMTQDVSRSGIVPLPMVNERPIGGHAVMAVGYDDSIESLIVRNSWGTSWGIDGYFYLPYWFITTPNAAADFWTIRMIESNNE